MVLTSSVHDGPVLDVLSGPSFSTVPSVSTVQRYLGTGSDTGVSVQGFQGIFCIFLILVIVRFNFWCHFGIVSVPTQVKLTALVYDPKLTGT